MESPSFEEENIIEDVRNLFRLKKENKAIKDIILRDIRNILRNEEEENYYKPVRAKHFWNNNYIEYKSNGDRNKTVSVEDYLNKIRPYLKDIINNLKKFDTWKIQLTIENNLISSMDNDKECVMHSNSDNVEILINDEADKVMKELFDSLKNRYQNNFKSMKGSEFVFNYVQSLCYKCHKIRIAVDHIWILLIG